MEISEVFAFITAIIGSGGISALITARITAKKADAENRHTDQETEGLRIQNEITEMDYINKRLQEISEINRKEADELRIKNEALNDKISELNQKMQSLMQWVVCDNYQYRSWLENKLRTLDPNIDFPETSKPPSIFGVLYSDKSPSITPPSSHENCNADIPE